jgi:hypothetical protein
MDNFKLNNIDCVFTSSDSENNIILVESINETFFDIFECSIGNDKFIFEKIDEVDGLPLVLCDIIKDGKHYVTEAILKIGKVGEIFINESLMHKVIERPIIMTPAEKTEDNTETSTEDITETSTDVNNLIAEEIISRYNEDKIQEKITNYTNIYKSRLNEFEDKKKEFLTIIDGEFEDRVKTFNEEIDTKLHDFFKLNEEDNKFLVFNEAEKLRESVSDISEKFKLELKNVKEFSKENINRIIDNKSKEIYEKIYQHTDKLIEENKQTISKNIDNLSNTFTEELNQLKLLKNKIPATDKNIIERQNKKFKSILEHVNLKFNQLNKKVKLISESKNDEYNELLAAVNNKEVVEYKTILREKIETAELNSVKSELLNELNSNIQNEVRGMKRYAEMSAGGGTNAVQYAKGGTMDGNLNVTGELKADTILATTLLSATTMDINFELSGFSVTGDISANGDIYASKNIITTTAPTSGEHLTNKTYVDAQVAGAGGGSETLAGLTDVNITSIGDKEIIAYDNSSSKYVNKTLEEAGIAPLTDPTFTGNVGIGTDTPTFELDVVGSSRITGTLRISDKIMHIGDSDTAIRFPANDTITFETSATEKMRIDSDGNVGIGRTDPSKLLDIKDGDFRISSTEPKIFLNDTNNNSDFSIKNNNGSFQISDTTNGPTRLAIDSSGNVGIGTTTPNEVLDVVGNVKAKGYSLNANTFTTLSSTSTLAVSTNGLTLILQNPAPITITLPALSAGHVTTFIAETINAVTFVGDTGITVNSFGGDNTTAGQFAQCQVIYKTTTEVFLGGNLA